MGKKVIRIHGKEEKILEIQDLRKNYTYIAGYGAGQYFAKTAERIRNIITLDYICDRKWSSGEVQQEYKGIPVIPLNDLCQYASVLVVLFLGNASVLREVERELEEKKIDYVHVDELIGSDKVIDGQILKQEYPNGIYRDSEGNEVYFPASVSDHLKITFYGHDNKLILKEHVDIGALNIQFGNYGICTINENTEIVSANFFISDASIKIGRDCLFSYQINLRTHDSHHIFDLDTHERLNKPENIEISDNVWISQGVTLLGGAKIGTGSVVGTGCITSSQFGDHKIIAGIPGKIIKENICWSRDHTAYFNRNYLEECVSQEALKYLG